MPLTNGEGERRDEFCTSKDFHIFGKRVSSQPAFLQHGGAKQFS